MQHSPTQSLRCYSRRAMKDIQQAKQPSDADSAPFTTSSTQASPEGTFGLMPVPKRHPSAHWPQPVEQWLQRLHRLGGSSPVVSRPSAGKPDTLRSPKPAGCTRVDVHSENQFRRTRLLSGATPLRGPGSRAYAPSLVPSLGPCGLRSLSRKPPKDAPYAQQVRPAAFTRRRRSTPIGHEVAPSRSRKALEVAASAAPCRR